MKAKKRYSKTKGPHTKFEIAGRVYTLYQNGFKGADNKHSAVAIMTLPYGGAFITNKEGILTRESRENLKEINRFVCQNSVYIPSETRILNNLGELTLEFRNGTTDIKVHLEEGRQINV